MSHFSLIFPFEQNYTNTITCQNNVSSDSATIVIESLHPVTVIELINTQVTQIQLENSHFNSIKRLNVIWT